MEQDRINELQRRSVVDRFPNVIRGVLLLCAIAFVVMGSTYADLLIKYHRATSELQQVKKATLDRATPYVAPSADPDLKRRSGDGITRGNDARLRPIKQVTGVRGKFAPVLYFGGLSPRQQLPLIRELLTRLHLNNVCATFIFKADSKYEPRILRQVRSHCHEVGFEDKVPSWAQPDAPFLASADLQSADLKDRPYIYFIRHVGKPPSTVRAIVRELLSTASGQIIRLDPSQNPNSVHALGRALPQLTAKSIRAVSVGQLLAGQSRRDEPAQRADLMLVGR